VSKKAAGRGQRKAAGKEIRGKKPAKAAVALMSSVEEVVKN
jgi:hypothetical protein